MVLRALSVVLETRFPQLQMSTYTHAESALPALKAARYDAVITDLQMPGMDGLTFIRHVRRLQPSTGVILITGEASADIEAKAIAAGADNVLFKPIDAHHLIARLHDAMTRKRVREKEEPMCEPLGSALEHELSLWCHECQATVVMRSKRVRTQDSIILHFDCPKGHRFHTDPERLYRSLCDCPANPNS
jgi:DNA-binding response OmpR family regulator